MRLDVRAEGVRLPLRPNRSHTITAYLDVPEVGADGVVMAAGGTARGIALYVKDGRPVSDLEKVRAVQWSARQAAE